MAPSVCQYRTAPSVGFLMLGFSSCPSLPKISQACCLPRDAQVDFVTSVSRVSRMWNKSKNRGWEDLSFSKYVPSDNHRLF